MDVPVRFIGRHGLFGLQSWAPVREPGRPSSPATVISGSQPDRQTAAANVQPPSVVNRQQPSVQQQHGEAHIARANVQPSPIVNHQQPPVQLQRYEAQTAPANGQLSLVVNPQQPPVQQHRYETQTAPRNVQWQMLVNSQQPPMQQQHYETQAAAGNVQWLPPVVNSHQLPVHQQCYEAAQTVATNVQWSPQPPVQQQRHEEQSVRMFTNATEPVANNSGGSSEKNSSTVKALSAPGPKQRLVAKYDYTANVNSPLGQNAELDLHQFDKMSIIAAHPQQEFWWLVEMDDGRRGYVPANYVMVFEDRITTLPWLANRPVEPLPPVSNLPYKPYKSAYDKESTTATPNSQYFCEVCQKQLNGPQPYSAHMNSKAHREEVELAAYYKS